ncbi:MAG TPA: radical SAM protein [Desulfatiglandales bacterium]|nr:radical SAM protein [Desulfatiglandales bacterium]
MREQSPHYQLSSLYLYLVDQCNLSCRHCWISPGFSQDQKDGISIEYLKRTISEAKGLGLQSVKLTGGEPLLYRDIYALLEFLAAEKINILIETNGTLLNNNILEKLKSCEIELISVSLDADTPEVHDKIRGVKGSFDRTIAGLRMLSEYGFKFQIIMTLHRKNFMEIPGLISLCKDLGAGSLKINPLLPCGRGKEVFRDRQNLDLGELVQIYRMVEREWSVNTDLDIIFDLPVALRSITDIKRRGIIECRILNILGILANGDFSICGIGQTIDELRMGNIYQDSIKDVWKENLILVDLRQGLPGRLKGICGRCIFRFQCLGSCRANAYAMTKDLFAPYFICEESYESGLFPDSRVSR